jgi:hypothetical protein
MTKAEIIKNRQRTENLQKTLRRAALDAEPHLSSLAIAEALYDAEPRLIQEFSREWIVDRLATLLRLHRAKARVEESPQMLLGFSKLPVAFVPKLGGKRIDLGAATLMDLRQFRSRILGRKSPRLDEVEKAIALMEPYARKEHGITFGEVAEKAAKEK